MVPGVSQGSAAAGNMQFPAMDRPALGTFLTFGETRGRWIQDRRFGWKANPAP